MSTPPLLRIELPALTIEPLEKRGHNLCELPLCVPVGVGTYACLATHQLLLSDGMSILLCDRHAVGFVALGEFLKHGPLELQPLGDDAEQPSSIARSTLTPESEVAKWNRLFAVGTPVEYWTGIREGRGKRSRTRTEARVVGLLAVVWLEDEAACVALSHVAPHPL